MKLTRPFCIKVAATLLCFFMAISLAIPDGISQMDNDVKFLQEAAVNSTWKIAIGNLAIKQAASDDVKKYGKQMAEDHKQIVNELKVLAAGKGVALGSKTDMVRQNTLTFLSQEFGAAFDRNYMSLAMDDNQQDVFLYRNEAGKGQDPAIVAFAAKVLGKLEEYVRTAEKILHDLPKPLLK